MRLIYVLFKKLFHKFKKADVPWNVLIVLIVTLVAILLFFISRKVWTTILG